jgi:hypothetical protein
MLQSDIQPITEIKAFDSLNTATLTAIQLQNTEVKLRLNSLLSLLEQFITILVLHLSLLFRIFKHFLII